MPNKRKKTKNERKKQTRHKKKKQKKEKKGHMNLTQLPYEIGIHIGKFLKDKDLANFTLTSSHFSQLCKDEQLFFELYKRDFLTFTSSSSLQKEHNKKQKEQENQKEEQEERRKKNAGWLWKEMYIILWQSVAYIKGNLKHFYGLIEKNEIQEYQYSIPYTFYHIHPDADDEDDLQNFANSMVGHDIMHSLASKTPKFCPDKLRFRPVKIHHLDAKNLFLKIDLEVKGVPAEHLDDLITNDNVLIEEGYVKWSNLHKKYMSMYPMDGLRNLFYYYCDKYELKSYSVNEAAKEFMNRQYVFKLGTTGTQFFITEDEIVRILNNNLKKHDLEVASFNRDTFQVTCNRKPNWRIPENRCLHYNCTAVGVTKGFCAKHKVMLNSMYQVKQMRAIRKKERHAEYVAYFKRVSSLGGERVLSFGSESLEKGVSLDIKISDGGAVEKSVDGVPVCIKVDIKGKVNGFILNMVTP